MMQIPEPPTPDDFDQIFDRIDSILDRLGEICYVALGVVIVLAALWILTKIFGGGRR